MKSYILTTFFVVGLIISVTAQEKEKEMIDCKEFKNGHFIVKEGLIGKKYIIKRKGKKQIETSPDGTTFVFRVNWIDNCSYTLELTDIEENPNNIDWQEGQIITVSILETTENGYKQRSVSNLDNLVFEKEMVKVKAKKAKEFLDEENDQLSEEI